MAVSGKKLWQRLSLVHPSSEMDTAEGLKLFREYTHRGYLRREDSGTDDLPAGVLVDFFRRLSLLRSASSPVCRRRDPRWMSGSDFQFCQLRDTGSFLKAVEILPFLRTDALILLPVTRIQEEYPLAPVSHALLDPVLSDPVLESCGFSLEDQFQIFVAAAHLSGVKVGYFLSPLVAPDSAVIYRKPEFFSWGKAGRIEEDQNPLLEEVRRIVAFEYESTGQYNYSRIRKQVNAAQLSLHHAGEGTVCFNLENGDCREYFADIFLNLQLRYALDFIYLSLPEGMNAKDAGQTVSLVQNPGKGSLKKYTGWIVDHPLQELEADFQEVTNLFSSHQLRQDHLGEEDFHRWFLKLGELYEINQDRKIPYSRAIALPSAEQNLSHALRLYFLSRFSGLTGYRRPLLIGQEYLQRPGFRDIQNRIEDVHTRYTGVFQKGHLLKVVADTAYAWWIIRERNRILISLVGLDYTEENGVRESVPSIRIDYSEFVSSSKILTVVEYDFNSDQGNLYLSADNSLVVEDLPEKGFRLFSLQ